MRSKPKIYFTSFVFTSQVIGTNPKISLPIRTKITQLWDELNKISDIKIFDGRFPSEAQLKEEVQSFDPDLIGCHLSHPISSELLQNSNVFAVSTSTAGYNHIQKVKKDDILITYTPGVLHETVADYTIALIMANLRNIVDLHNYVWDNKWSTDEHWDLDQNLSSVFSHKVLGIVGMGEIGTEVLKKVYPWGIKVIYYDIRRRDDLEEKYPEIEFRDKLEAIFRECDVISIHIPLNKFTENIINRNLFKLMKNDSLLINTSRGGVLNLDDLMDLIEKQEISINYALDVFPMEPIDEKTLYRLKTIKKKFPDIRQILMPHNASADADTRGKMVLLFLQDLISLIKSSKIEDLKDLNIIPEHKSVLFERKWRIYQYWANK